LRQGKGVEEPLGVRKGFLVPLLCLVRIPQHPQAQSAKETAGYSGVLAVAEGMGAMLLRVIHGQPVLQVGVGKDKFPQPRQGISQCPVRLQKQHGVLQLPSHVEKFLPQLTRPLQLPPY